jgi:hypothetical protein
MVLGVRVQAQAGDPERYLGSTSRQLWSWPLLNCVSDIGVPVLATTMAGTEEPASGSRVATKIPPGLDRTVSINWMKAPEVVGWSLCAPGVSGAEGSLAPFVGLIRWAKVESGMMPLPSVP